MIWIDLVGGWSDSLLVSGILKQVHEQDPSQQFNLVERTRSRAILEGHPAIAAIGNPPPGARLIRTDYWNHLEYQGEYRRAYQVLAGIFGLEIPIEERVYVPWEFQENSVVIDAIPWKTLNVLIAPSSESPRKEIPVPIWEQVVEMLSAASVLVVQATILQGHYIRGAYSLLGLTGPKELISMINRFDVVITSDTFMMGASHLCGVPAVVLWGPTDPKTHGFPEQTHLQAALDCEYSGGCLRHENSDRTSSKCPLGDEHCMNKFSAKTIFAATMTTIENKRRRGPESAA